MDVNYVFVRTNDRSDVKKLQYFYRGLTSTKLTSNAYLSMPLTLLHGPK